MKALGCIKRLIVLAFITALLTFGVFMCCNVNAQALTYHGDTGGGPQYFIVEKANICGIDAGDRLTTYYSWQGQNYASYDVEIGLQAKYIIQKRLNNDDYPVKTGFGDREVVSYAVWRFGNYYHLETDKDWRFTKATVTDSVININNNAYYSIAPQWPDIDYSYTVEGFRMKRGYSYLWELLDVRNRKVNYSPQFYERLSIEVLDVTPNVPGRPLSYIIAHRGNWLQTRYRVTQDDIERGYISFKLIVEPLPDAMTDSGNLYRVLEIRF